MSYRIGLDIGIASVGWCVFGCDSNGEPTRIKNLGVRVFDVAEQPKTGASLAAPRREARSARRRLRRRSNRIIMAKNLLAKTFGTDILEKIEENNDDLFALRVRALESDISAEELGKIYLYFCKHRGFLSNKKSETKANADVGKLLTAVTENRKYMEEKGYRTIGEMIYKDPKYSDVIDGRKIYLTRNHGGDYSKSFFRVDLESELRQIYARQAANLGITEGFVEESVKIFKEQRSYDEGPGGNSPYRIDGYDVKECPFEPGEHVAPKASYAAEYANALQKINNLSITYRGEDRFLTDDERNKVIETAKKQKEVTFAKVKKLLALPEDATFNLLSYSDKNKTQEETEKAKIFSMAKSYEINGELSDANKNNLELIDGIAEVLSLYKSDNRRTENFAKLGGLSSEEVERLLYLDYSGFAGLSLKALRKIIPYLEGGKKYSEACTLAGYEFKGHANNEKMDVLKGKVVQDVISDITSPVAKRAISQTIKVINAIIRKEGAQPCGVNIELARDLARSRKVRDKIKFQNDKNADVNAKALKDIAEKYNRNNISSRDVLKYKLYEEQGGKCAYSLQSFDPQRIFEDGYAEVDHIIPYSRSFDDSFNNKVLVLKKENQDKRNKIPYEYFGSDVAHWAKFEDFVNYQYKAKHNTKKANNLLKKKFDDSDASEWKNRALNDTQYISRVVYSLVNDYLLLEPIEGKKKQVITVNGKITSYLRKVWGLIKVREDGDKHHAMDAAVIGTVTDRTIQRVTQYSQLKERNAHWDVETHQYLYMDKDGELLNIDRFNDKYGYDCQPYKFFRDELKVRVADAPKDNMDICSTILPQLGYAQSEIDGILPIFVSRMPNRKATGAIHAETMRSMRAFSSGLSSSKTDLTKLKLTKDKKDIEGYNEKARESDIILYNALLARLQAFGGDAEEAFKEPFYKPTTTGKRGNPVRKVWVDTVFNTGVVLEKRRLLADNGGMVRVDIFTKAGKYYTVPVYLKDIYSHNLPNKAITCDRTYAEWDEIDESYEFLFSLYSRDLVYLEDKKPFQLKVTNVKSKIKAPTDITNGLFYYISININDGCAKFINNDNSLVIEKKGLKTVGGIKKYQVDILGEVSEVGKEVRPNLEWLKK